MPQEAFMYTIIAVPVDLAHTPSLDKALQVSADIAKVYGASIHLIGVTTSAPSSVAHDPAEFQRKLEAYAAAQSNARGIAFAAHTTVSHDPTTDVDEAIAKAAKALNADLIVMATHVPTFADVLFGSRTGHVAAHVNVSVLAVR